MDLYEYQAKELFAGADIPVPRGKLASEEAELRTVLEEIGRPCVLKAQILRGGRGKAGLIRFAEDREEALAEGKALLASPHRIDALLVEEKLEIGKELYLALTVDPAAAAVRIMASARGGVDIERTAERSPGDLSRVWVDTCRGPMPFQLRNLLRPLCLPKEVARPVARIVERLFALMRRHDATLVEINPLVVTRDGRCVAADGKMTIDDSALYRQPFERRATSFADRIEYEAAREGIPYVRFDGNIGLMCAGAGLTNTVNDLIRDFGGRPANFLEFGGPNYRKALQAMRLTLESNPVVILIVTFGTIARADVMAEGIAGAIRELEPRIPIVAAIRGTGEEKAAEILRQIGLEPLFDTEEAVRKAVALAGGSRP